eukprot:2403759-Rhodomonas_salina.1
MVQAFRIPWPGENKKALKKRGFGGIQVQLGAEREGGDAVVVRAAADEQAGGGGRARPEPC